ncbi:MAG: hypothetical protein ABEJ56_01770 [Candidatus Nanohaloarchaea archaeon]
MGIDDIEDAFEGNVNELERHLENLREKHESLAREEGDALKKAEILKDELHRVESLENRLRTERRVNNKERKEIAKQYDIFNALLHVVAEEVYDIVQKIEKLEQEASTIQDVHQALSQKRESLNQARKESDIEFPSKADKDWSRDEFKEEIKGMSAEELAELISS